MPPPIGKIVTQSDPVAVTAITAEAVAKCLTRLGFSLVVSFLPDPRGAGFSTFVCLSAHMSVCMYVSALISFILHGQYTSDPQEFLRF